MMTSSATLNDEPGRNDGVNTYTHFQKLLSNTKKSRIKTEEDLEELRSRHDSEMLVLQLEQQLRKPIKFDDEDQDVMDFSEDDQKFDQLIEELMKKNEQLEQICQNLMSEQVKATYEAANMTLGLQKNFKEALEYYDIYTKRIQKTMEHRETNRTTYLNELQTIRENFIKSTEQGRQKHKQSTHELKQEMQKILKHPSLPLLAKKLDGLYRSLDQQTRNLEI